MPFKKLVGLSQENLEFDVGEIL